MSKTITVQVSTGGISLTPSSPLIEAGEEVVWNVNGASGLKMRVAFTTAGVTPGSFTEDIVAGSQAVKRNIVMSRTTQKKPDRTGAGYTISFGPGLSTSVATDTLMIERGVEPTGEGDGHKHPWRNHPSDRYPGGAETPDPCREEQRLGG
jgi:hypothetical protein